MTSSKNKHIGVYPWVETTFSPPFVSFCQMVFADLWDDGAIPALKNSTIYI